MNFRPSQQPKSNGIAPNPVSDFRSRIDFFYFLLITSGMPAWEGRQIGRSGATT